MTTVLASLSVLKDHIKLKVNQSPVIDNIVFRLHYRATFIILLTSSILVTSRQFFGEHIKCIVGNDKLPVQAINTYCFITSTFTLSKYMNTSLHVSKIIPHLGVGPVDESQDHVRYHAYYQWVPFILFTQAIVFYLPHYYWKKAEGGRIKVLISGLSTARLTLQEESLKINDGLTILSVADRDRKIDDIREDFLNRLHENRPWVYQLVLCEVFNFINILAQFYITDLFLDGSFMHLGYDVNQHMPDVDVNPLEIVFPKVTKCTFRKYGPSGTIEKHDSLCVMALNIINEKIYIFLWYWFIIVAILTGLNLLWRMLTMLLHAKSLSFNRYVFALACPGKYNPWNVLKVTHDPYYGDWLFLYYIAKNLDNYVFKELLERLAHDLEDRKQRRLMSQVPPSLVSEALLKKN